MELTVNTAEKIREEAWASAVVATNNYIEKYLDGEDKYACGFAWVTVYPKHKGNTKLGREERNILAALGLKKDWTGKAYQWWNPSNCGFQNIDCKEAGAQAAAKILTAYGLEAYAGSRLD